MASTSSGTLTYSVAVKPNGERSKRVSLNQRATRVVWHRKGLTGHLTMEHVDEMVHPWATQKYGAGNYRVITKPIADPGQQILAAARKHMGVKESPPGSNRGPKIGEWMRRVGYNQPGPWCAGFASCMCDDAGYPLARGGSASCRVLRERAQAAGRWRSTGSPKPGWLGIVRGDKHVVIVERVTDSGRIVDISGNTSRADGANYNGGEVARHTHNVSDFSGFIDTTTPRKKAAR